ncbi:ABC transporter ATP-binding protein [Alishewanella tabrizica]|uniref:ABC transporter n=1 Tax=Alishewanella tabrizica TaxID=671278 RepID=A0ABQ2WSQ0_9ALTE|nr:ABC transporter ATP-binding protein [Alishewanella tabrizica]GGW66168.1 ABC transporter [Alishewanella tabrizica]
MTSIVHITNLQRRMGKQSVLQNINSEVRQGDVIALLGKNGAGKTTLLETILGLALPTAGEVRVFGTLSHEITSTEKQRIGFVPQQDELLEQLTPREHLSLFAQFQAKWNNTLCERLCQSWEIPLNTRISKLSLGQRQKLSIILALCHQPDLLILDEPVASLDPIARRQFLTELISIALDQQTAIIFSSHIVTDMERVATKVWLLKDHQLCWQGELDMLKEHVVRLHISAESPLPTNLVIANSIRHVYQGKTAMFTVTGWHDALKHTLEQQLQADVRVEYLNLEDIFLELNA